MAESNYNIQETGPVGLKGIRGEDLYSNISDEELLNINRRAANNNYEAARGHIGYEAIYNPALTDIQVLDPDTPLGQLGKSQYDEIMVNPSPEEMGDYRAINQPWWDIVSNDIVKGTGLVATTYLDGMGLLYGIGSAIANKDPGEIFNNEFSLGLRTINEYLEEALPVYRTQDARENPMALRNLITIETFADDLLKNIGFSVGANFSALSYLSLIKKIGSLTKLGELSSTVAKLTGSILSGINEGRIEAGNLYDEKSGNDIQSLLEAYKSIILLIMSEPDTLELNPETGIAESSRQRKLKELLDRYKKEESAIKQRATNAGIMDLILNSVYLPFTNFYTWGKLYARKTRMNKDLTNRVGKKVTMDDVAELISKEEALGNKIVRNADGTYTTKPISRTAPYKRGLGIFATEYSEEVNQGGMQSFSTNFYSPDSPDAYYQALTKDEYEANTKDFMTSLVTAFNDSWGTLESHKEGIIGGLTGLIGLPTFGRITNSDHNTYLGRGKMIGLSGGLFGEISNEHYYNQQALEATSRMNAFVNKVNNAKMFFTRSQSFTDAMDGYSQEDNKFEFQNAKDNDLFNVIDAFGRTGRMQDLRDLINEDFKDLSDKRLAEIAAGTEGDLSNWRREVDGSFMPDTEVGRAEMREKLNTRRERILEGINSYEKALQTVRAMANNSLTEDLNAELAWLRWKKDRFEQRFTEIGNDSEDDSSKLTTLEFITNLREAMDTFLGGKYKSILETEVTEPVLDDPNYTRELYDKDTQLMYRLLNSLDKGTITDKQRVQLQHVQERLAAHRQYDKPKDTRTLEQREFDANQGKQILENMKAVRNFLQALENSKSALLLGSLINNHPEIVDYINSIGYNLLEGILDADYDTFTLNMKNLADIAKIAQAAKDFNDRYREFTEDPYKLILNRQNIDNKKQEAKLANSQLNDVNAVRDAEIADLARQAREGNINLDAISDTVSLMQDGEPKDEVRSKIEEAKRLNLAYEDIKNELQNSVLPEDAGDPMLAQLTANDAERLLNAALLTADSAEALKNLESEAWLDMRNLSSDEQAVLEAEMPSRFDKARKLAQLAIDNVKPAKPVTQTDSHIEDKGSTGHDAVDNTKTANEQKKAAQITKLKQQLIAYLRTIYNEGVLRLLTTIPLEKVQLCANDFNSVMKDTEALIILGKDAATIGTTIGEKDSYKRLKAQFPTQLDSLLNYFVTKHPAFIGNSTNASTLQQQELLKRQGNQSERGVPTPNIENTEITRNSQASDEYGLKQGGLYQYIRTYTSLWPFGQLSGLLIPFYQTLRKEGNLWVQPDTRLTYTEEQYKRMKAVYEYLERAGAFDRVNKGIAKPNAKVKFKIDSNLNTEAGDTVILITDENGLIIGDLPPKAEAANYAGLTKLINDIENQYAKEGKITITGEISANKVGKVGYSNTHIPLNTIVGENPLILGISLKDNRIIIDGGRTKDGKGKRDSLAIPAANASDGLPFIMLTTSDEKRKYIPVPIRMEPFAPSNEGSTLHLIVRDILQHILQKDGRADVLQSELLDVLALKDVEIKYGENYVRIRSKAIGEEWQTLYEGPLTSDISTILPKLYGVPYQISKKFINGKYKGRDYNRIIGELATTNLPIGTTHTVSDWFTIKVPNAKTDSGKSTRINNHRSEGAFLSLRYAGHKYHMDTKNNFEVYDENNQIYHGEYENILKAHAWGLHHNLNVESIWSTPWGNYNPKTGLFVVKQQLPTGNVILELQEASLQEIDEIIDYIEEMEASSLSTDGQENKLQIQLETQQKEKSLQQQIFDYLDTLPNQNKTVKAIKDKFLVDDNQATQYFNNYLTYTRNKFYKNHPNIQRVDLNFAGYFEGGGRDITDDFPGFNEELADKYQRYILGDGQFTELDAIDFLNEINRILRLKTLSAANPEIDELNEEECTLKVTSVGLLNNTIKQQLWSNLSLEAKRIIANKAGKPKARLWMDSLSKVFNAVNKEFELSKLPGKPKTIEEYLNSKPKYSKKNEGVYTVWDLEKEIKWLKKVLPQLSTEDLLRIHNGLIRISLRDGGGLAYGMFWKGIIIIASNAAKGTLYHEAFHFVTNILLTDEEYNELFTAAKERWGNLSKVALEEKLAEDFREYTELEETPILGSVVKIYRNLKHLVQSLFGKEPYINKVYYNINRGNYARRQILATDNISRFSRTNNDIRYRITDTTTIDELQNELFNLKLELESNKKYSNTEEDRIKKAYHSIGRRGYDIRNYGNGSRRYLRTSFAYKGLAEDFVTKEGLLGVVKVVEHRGRWIIESLLLREIEKYIEDVKQDILRQNSQIETTIATILERINRGDFYVQEEEDNFSLFRRVNTDVISQYHRDKSAFGNLSIEDKQYIQDRGISIEEYNNRSQNERKVLSYCK